MLTCLPTLQHNPRKTNNPIKKGAKDINRHFLKEDIQYRWLLNTRKDVQHHSLSEKCKSTHSEISPHTGQNGHHQRIHNNNKCWKGCGEKGNLMATHSSILAWRIPWTEEPGRLQSMGSQRVGHNWATSLSLSLWKTVWRFLKKLGIKLLYGPSIPLLGIYFEETKIEKDTCTPMFTAALFTIARTWKQLRCPSTDEWIKKLWLHIYNGILLSYKKGMHLSQF